MNLLFWKKKTGAREEAENAQEPLDFATTKQGVAERNPKSPEPEITSPENPAKPGLVARMKLRLIALTGYFKRTPAFHAKEGHVPDAPGGSEKPASATTIEPGLESPDMETPAKPGLAVRIKLRLISLARHFRKMPVPDSSEDQQADSHGRSETVSDGEHPEDVSGARSIRSRKRLVIGGAIGLLVLLLVSIGIAVWPVSTPPQKRLEAGHDVSAITSRVSQPASAPENTQTEIEALKKENAELQARIEALKKEQPQQQPYTPSARQAGGNVPSSSVSGEMMISGKDPKAAAMSLKEAIEAMNASSGDRGKKPAK